MSHRPVVPVQCSGCTPPILADQLTLSQPWEADYAHQIILAPHNKTMKKNHPQKLLIIGPNLFCQYCQPAQNQPKSKFLFHKIAYHTTYV